MLLMDANCELWIVYTDSTYRMYEVRALEMFVAHGGGRLHNI